MICSPNGLMRYNDSVAIVDDIPLLSQWIKKFLFLRTGIFWRRHPDLNRGSGFCRPMPYHLAMSPYSTSCHWWKKGRLKLFLSVLWSGWRGSNSLPPPWQGGALPDELHPHLWCLRSESNQWHGDFQSPALPTELQRQMWRPGTGSNRRPLAWQASVLTSWTTGPHWWEQQGSNLWPSACKADALPTELCFHIKFWLGA